MRLFQKIMELLHSAAKFPEKTVLLVDDDLDVREILAYSLKQPGIKILEAESGKEALDLIAKNEIDLLISDYYMPKMNGVEFIKKCQEQKTYLGPAIMISANVNDDIKKNASLINLVGFLAKNQNEELKNLISQELHRDINPLPPL